MELETSKTPKYLEEVVSPKMKEIFDRAGTFGLLMILLGVISGLYVKLFPSINWDLSLLDDGLTINGNSLVISNILMYISISSFGIFFLILVSKILYELIVDKIFPFIGVVLRGVFNIIIFSFQKFLLLLNRKDYARKLEVFVERFGLTVYTIPSWREPSDLVGKRRQLPISLENFKYVEFKILVHKKVNNHWRAGVTFEGDNNDEYIFHLHEDYSNPGIMYYRMVMRVPGLEVRDKRGEFGRIENNEIHFQVKKIDNKLFLIVNNKNLGYFDVPITKLQSLYLGAWADDRPFDIEFVNIEAASNSLKR